jgi:hypothetical protein
MRGKLDTDDLLKLILLLVLIWVVLEVLTEVLNLVGGVLFLAPNIIGLVIVVLIVLWLLDYF